MSLTRRTGSGIFRLSHARGLEEEITAAISTDRELAAKAAASATVGSEPDDIVEIEFEIPETEATRVGLNPRRIAALPGESSISLLRRQAAVFADLVDEYKKALEEAASQEER